MNSRNQSAYSPIAEQTINNTTSWIGQTPGAATELVKGQTFVAPAEADLQSIEVVPNLITDAGQLIMTLHSFDEQSQQWGPVLATATISVEKPDAGKWLPFGLAAHLQKGKTYGFRLQSHDALIGVGEAAGSANNPPLPYGHEWQFSGNNQQGDRFSYFSLAFRVGVRA
jgi:hypothetical protein